MPSSRAGYDRGRDSLIEMDRAYRLLHRYALVITALALIVILAGAYITSTEVTARQAQSTVSGVISEAPHVALSVALIILTLGAAIWSLRVKGVWVRTLAWAGFAMLALDGVLGWPGAPLSATLAIFHALLAHLFLSVAVMIAMLTSASWNAESERVDDEGWSLLRPLALATPAVVIIQIALGAMYRHQTIGILGHLAGAMVATLLTLIVSAVVLQNFPKPAPMRRAAAALISIVLTQICLGAAAFLMLVLNTAGTVAFLLITVGHVAVGAATLAASVVMAIQVARSLRPKASDPAATESV